MDIGAVLSEAWSLYTRFFARFVIVAGVVFLALGALATIIRETAPSGDGGRALAALAGTVVLLVGYYWIQGVLVVLAADVRDGVADHSFGELFARVRPRLGVLIGAGLLGGLGIAIGFILVIVPGLILLTRWAMIAPAVILERAGVIDAFRRSWDLTRGRAWPVFGMLVVLFLINVIVGTVIIGLAAGISDGFLGNWLGEAIAYTLITPYMSTATTLLYFRLAGDRPAAGVADPAPTF